jgi:uncharacterized membrane protein YeiH
VGSGWAEALGVAVFALTGALVAARKGLDPFGFALLATVTGVGGGTLRDLLLGAGPVFWVSDPRDVLICLAVAFLTFVVGTKGVASLEDGVRGRAVVWADAVGLSLFSVVGTERALAAGVPAVTAIVLGAVTATFGGIIRDLLAGMTPLILRREIYVTAAALGAFVMVALMRAGLDPAAAFWAGFASAFLLRALAILRGWSLPAFGVPDRNRPE